MGWEGGSGFSSTHWHGDEKVVRFDVSVTFELTLGWSTMSCTPFAGMSTDGIGSGRS